VKLGVAGGAHVADPAGLLEGTGKRHFAKASDFNRPGIHDLIHTADTRWKELRSGKA
jgi:hypothetical protein